MSASFLSKKKKEPTPKKHPEESINIAAESQEEERPEPITQYRKVLYTSGDEPLGSKEAKKRIQVTTQQVERDVDDIGASQMRKKTEQEKNDLDEDDLNKKVDALLRRNNK